MSLEKDTPNGRSVQRRPAGKCKIIDLASPFNLTTLKEEAHVVRTANCPKGGILIDTLYLHLSNADLTQYEEHARGCLETAKRYLEYA